MAGAPGVGGAGAPGGGGAGAGGSAGGASGGAAGSAGASSGGANVGGAASGASCAGKGYKLCEDFETGMVGALPTGWTKFLGYGGASAEDQTLSTENFHSGKMALKSLSAHSGISRIQKDIAGLGATASKHWGRIFYKVQSPAAIDNAAYLHVTFVSLFGASENRIVDTVEEKGSNKHQWLFNNPNDSGGKGSAYDWTFDAAWHCAEWYVDVGTKSYRFFSDAKEVTSIAFSNASDSQMSDYKSIIVGATHYQKDTLTSPFTVWFDDLAINDAQVGCQ